MNKIILLKYGEIILKGLNKHHFEHFLFEDVRSKINKYGKFKVYAKQSTGYIEPVDGADIDSAYEACKRVFGANSICLCATCEKDMDRIYATVEEFLGERLSGIKTFKVEAKRSDKQFALKSPQICSEVGASILSNHPHLKVDVLNPDDTVWVEIRDDYACIHSKPDKGAGGMPPGSNGKAALLISGGIDSPVAGYMISKRGLSLDAVHFFSYPYTSLRAKEKVISLLKEISLYTGPIRLSVVPFTEIQEKIRDVCREDCFTLVMRAFMMKIASEIAKNSGCGAVVTGESLGQVASQTMEALNVTNSYSSLCVFRPLIGMDKIEIIEIARKIGTFETSLLPYEDCCTVFTPKHPKTKPKKELISAEFEKLDYENLIKKAIENTEIIQID